MSSDIDVDVVDITREIIALEDELRTIDARIGAAIRSGDAIEADDLEVQKARLPMRIKVARAHACKLQIRAQEEEAARLDRVLPALAADLAAARNDAARIRADALAAIRAADLRADICLSDLKSAQHQRQELAQRINESQAALMGIGSSPTTTGPARVGAPALPSLRIAVVGESGPRPGSSNITFGGVETVIGDGVNNIG